jgi:putative transposase
MMANTDQLEPDHFYHCFNRANGKQDLFVEPGNYDYFLRKYIAYVSPIAHIFCYCLLPNHYHFLIKIRDTNTLNNFFCNKAPSDIKDWSNVLSKQFSNFSNAYAKAFNKATGRNGSLFSRPFRRKKVTDFNYLRKVVHYIHCNPIESGLSVKPEDYPYSSFHTICENNSEIIDAKTVIDWFGDIENFKHIHQEPPHTTGIN